MYECELKKKHECASPLAVLQFTLPEQWDDLMELKWLLGSRQKQRLLSGCNYTLLKQKSMDV